MDVQQAIKQAIACLMFNAASVVRARPAERRGAKEVHSISERTAPRYTPLFNTSTEILSIAEILSMNLYTNAAPQRVNDALIMGISCQRFYYLISIQGTQSGFRHRNSPV